MSTPYRVILAESDAVRRTSFARLLRKCYPSVTLYIVADGLAALRMYEQRGADMIVTAHALPRMDGSELIRALRNRQANVPIVGISDDAAAEQDLRSAGANTFLSASVALPVLCQAVYQLLPE